MRRDRGGGSGLPLSPPRHSSGGVKLVADRLRLVLSFAARDTLKTLKIRGLMPHMVKCAISSLRSIIASSILWCWSGLGEAAIPVWGPPFDSALHPWLWARV